MEFATVTAIEALGEGTRVCIDFIDMLEPDEGVLVGNTGHGYLLLLAESQSTPTYPARPFRVNIGAIHQYLLMDKDKTCYLSDLRAGMLLPVFRPDGSKRLISIGRIKIEKRPMLRIECEAGENSVSCTLQSSDSVAVCRADGGRVAVSEIKKGDQVVLFADSPGRHIGERIEEFIQEQ